MENRLMAVVNTVATLLQKPDDNNIGDLRGLFRELVIRLEDSFRFTKEQNVCLFLWWYFPIDLVFVLKGKYSESNPRSYHKTDTDKIQRYKH